MRDFVSQLKHYINDGVIEPHIAEEYLNNAGELDIYYIQQVTKKRTTGVKLKFMSTELLGIFTQEDAVNEVTKKEFDAIYRFGKFPNVRSWIGLIFVRSGKLLTREKLFEYLS